MANATSNVRISRDAAVVLEQLTARLGRSKAGVVEQALRVLDETTFAAEVHDAYLRLRADTEAWRAYSDESDSWDRLAGDGLPKETLEAH